MEPTQRRNPIAEKAPNNLGCQFFEVFSFIHSSLLARSPMGSYYGLNYDQAKRGLRVGYLQFIEDALHIRWRSTGAQLFNVEIKKPPKGYHNPPRGFTLATSGIPTFSSRPPRREMIWSEVLEVRGI